MNFIRIEVLMLSTSRFVPLTESDRSWIRCGRRPGIWRGRDWHICEGHH